MYHSSIDVAEPIIVVRSNSAEDHLRWNRRKTYPLDIQDLSTKLINPEIHKISNRNKLCPPYSTIEDIYPEDQSVFAVHKVLTHIFYNPTEIS
jgi:hypothetical protein